MRELDDAELEVLAGAVELLPAGPYHVTQFGSGDCNVTAAPHSGEHVGDSVGRILSGYRHDRAATLQIAEAMARCLTALPRVIKQLASEHRARKAAEDEARMLRVQLAAYQASDKRPALYCRSGAFRVRDGWCLVNNIDTGLASFGFEYPSLEALQRAWRVAIGPRKVHPRDGEYVEIIPLDEALAEAGR